MVIQKRLQGTGALRILCLLLASGCAEDTRGGVVEAGASELVIYAAASTRDALREIEMLYESRHGVDLVFSFGSSGDLARQIGAAARAEVFLSADEREMERLEAAGLVAPGTVRSLLSNRLVVIEPAGEPSSFLLPFAPEHLGDPRIVRLSLAEVETVPAGRYAKAWLERALVWQDVAGRVLPGVDVRAALAAVESGGAQAGIVYATDAATSERVRVVFEVPREEGPPIAYPVGVLAGRPAEREARTFVDFLVSREAGAVFSRLGFVFLPAEDKN